MKYNVRFPTESIQKKFQKALGFISSERLQDEIMQSIEGLADNPRPAGEPKIKPPLIVYGFAAQYRLRVRNYRILYDVDDKNRIVWVFDIRKRNERTYD
ncbi:MAG: type II toxin-antitoxin system RelE/ParE family toxin [Candidatus Omnitrophica bacterium]|nr:type II toxin-antitoxin system RelE/ParE family toxin [Candidatus Omnitrophota bacterium]